MKKVLRPKLRYHLIQWIISLPFLIPSGLFAIYASDLRIRILGLVIFLYLSWLLASNIRDFLRYRLEVTDHAVKLPFVKNIAFPIDLDGKILDLPGLDLEDGVLQSIPFMKDIFFLSIPVANITGIWFDKAYSGVERINFSTDICDIELSSEAFDQKKLNEFLENNFPKSLLAPSVKNHSVVYASINRYLDKLLETTKDQKSEYKSSFIFLIAVSLVATFFGFGAWKFLQAGEILAALLCLLPSGLMIYWFERSIGKKELYVDEKKIRYSFRNKTKEILWDEIESFTMPERLILRSNRINIAIPKDLVRDNLLLRLLLSHKSQNNEIQVKATWFDRVFRTSYTLPGHL